MAKTSKDILAKSGFPMKLRLLNKVEGGGAVSTGPHKVKFIEDKVIKGINSQTGKEEYKVRYIFEDEKGDRRRYEVPMNNKEGTEPHYFVQRMADIEEGTEVILESKKLGIKNYTSITIVGQEDEEAVIQIGDEEDKTH